LITAESAAVTANRVVDQRVRREGVAAPIDGIAYRSSDDLWDPFALGRRNRDDQNINYIASLPAPGNPRALLIKSRSENA
jgi:hypothetical protein